MKLVKSEAVAARIQSATALKRLSASKKGTVSPKAEQETAGKVLITGDDILIEYVNRLAFALKEISGAHHSKKLSDE